MNLSESRSYIHWGYTFFWPINAASIILALLSLNVRVFFFFFIYISYHFYNWHEGLACSFPPSSTQGCTVWPGHRFCADKSTFFDATLAYSSLCHSFFKHWWAATFIVCCSNKASNKTLSKMFKDPQELISLEVMKPFWAHKKKKREQSFNC